MLYESWEIYHWMDEFDEKKNNLPNKKQTTKTKQKV